MSDFRIETSWRRSRKRRRLLRRLGADAVIAIEDLWSFCADDRKDGNLAGLTNEDIADEVGWRGDPDELVSVLLDLRLLDGKPGYLHLHNWETRQPYLMEQHERQEQARYAAHIKHHENRKTPKIGCSYCFPAETAIAVEQHVPNNGSAPADPSTELNQQVLDRANRSAPSYLPTNLPSIPAAPRAAPADPAAGPPVAQRVWDHWRTYHDRAGALVPSSAARYILERLAEGRTAEDLCTAIDGLHKDPWEGRKDHQQLRHALKDDEAVTKFIEIAEGANKPKGPPIRGFDSPDPFEDDDPPDTPGSEGLPI